MITNRITIDVEALMNAPDGSITDAETIRQIGLLSLQNPYVDLSCKIMRGLEVHALYPHVVKSYNILPITGGTEMKTKFMAEQASLRQLQRYPNVLNIYVFGSHVYGTVTSDSDTDLIVVAKQWFDSADINIHVYTEKQFELLVQRHDIQAMECMFAPLQFIIKMTVDFPPFILDLQQLRVAVSTISSNSWVKGKKKLIVAGDYDMDLAIKSIFHSLRILDFGIQIATDGKITDFSSMNYVLSDMRKLAEQYQREELWSKIDDKYRKLFNAATTQFKLLAPKDISEKDKKIQLEKILTKHSVTLTNSELVDEILNLFQK